MALRPIFRGSYSKALALRTILSEEGIASVILDENIKNVDPFVTGGQVFDVTLAAPEELAAQASEFLEQRRSPEPQPEEAAAESDGDRSIRALSRRIRWASVMIFTVPFALYYFRPYLRAVRGLHPKPPLHFWTCAALVYGVLSISVVVLVPLAIVLTG